jgi:hypothetical protein
MKMTKKVRAELLGHFQLNYKVHRDLADEALGVSERTRTIRLEAAAAIVLLAVDLGLSADEVREEYRKEEVNDE